MLTSIKDYVAAEKERIKEDIAYDHEALSRTYQLDIFQINHDPASDVYVRNKMKDCEELGIKAVLHQYDLWDDCCPQFFLGDTNMYRDMCDDITKAMSIENTNGIILQLPVPKWIDPKEFLKEMALYETDVDGIAFDYHKPCTARGIMDWLRYNKVDLCGKNVVIIGRSDLVGKPLARLMTDADATVTLCHSHTDSKELIWYCRHADIIVSAVGKPKFLETKFFNGMEKIIIDVGINRDENGKLCGDVLHNATDDSRLYVTPVPGGVGLLTRLALIKNVIGEPYYE